MKILIVLIAGLFLGSLASANCENAASDALAGVGIRSRPERTTYTDDDLRFALATASIADSDRWNLVTFCTDPVNELFLSSSHAGLWLVIMNSKTCSIISLTQLQAI